MNKAFKFRFLAAGWHMMGSVAVALLASLLVFLLWYPWPYYKVSGGAELFGIVSGCDVILGPLITLAIFSVAKPRRELARDMAVVVAIQLAALVYGLHTMYVARPAALAFEGERFRLTIAAGIVESELPNAPEGLQSLSLLGPVLVNTREPELNEKFDAVIVGMAGVDIGARPSFWRHWDEAARAAVLRVGKPLTTALAKADVDRRAVREAATRTGKPIEQLLYIPLIARRYDWSVLIDKATGDPVGFAPVDGF